MQDEGAAGSGAPVATVVVSTYDRPEMLEELVESLLAQDLEDLEVVVVDNGSRPDTDAVLRSLAERDTGACLRTLRIDVNRGPARARNEGWRSARSDVVLFTDDDCRVRPTWARELSAPLLSGDSDLAQGATVPDARDHVVVGPWDRTQRIRRWSGLFETCNIAYRRSVLEEVGGFDESFPIPAGEDTDLGLRALATGARPTFVETAVVEHTIWRQTYRRYLQDRMRMVHLVPLVKRHPALRRALPYRIFWQRGHARTLTFVLVCVGAGVARPALGPAALAGWVLVKARNVPGPPHRRVAVAGMRIAGGLVEIGAMAASSVRTRCLVL